MRRLPRFAAVVLLCAWPLLVFAQPVDDHVTDPEPTITAAGVTENMPKSSAFWTIFLTAIALPFIGKAVHLVADLFFTWARARGLKKITAWEKAYRIADSLIGFADAQTATVRKKALDPSGPGGSKVTPEEARELQTALLDAGKRWLGEGGLEQLAGEAGVAAAGAEEWLKGVIEHRFGLKKLAETAAEAAPAPTASAEVVDAAGTVIGTTVPK